MPEYRTLAEFWPFYLREHSRPATRALHLLGSAGALAFLALAIALLQPWLLLAALATGYGLAWIAHFGVERNRPATFRYPWKSFASDWKMLWYFVTGRLGKELERNGLR